MFLGNGVGIGLCVVVGGNGRWVSLLRPVNAPGSRESMELYSRNSL